jgi:hypothetical protein
MFAFFFQQVDHYPDSMAHLTSKYGDPGASPELVYVSVFLNLYTKV